MSETSEYWFSIQMPFQGIDEKRFIFVGQPTFDNLHQLPIVKTILSLLNLPGLANGAMLLKHNLAGA